MVLAEVNFDLAGLCFVSAEVKNLYKAPSESALCL